MAAAKPASCSLNDALSKYLDTLKVSNAGPAKAEIEKVVKDIMKRVEAEDSRFKMGLEFRGSMYEKLKIKEANEIDFDLPLTKLTIDEAPRNGLPNTIPQGLFDIFAYCSSHLRYISHSAFHRSRTAEFGLFRQSLKCAGAKSQMFVCALSLRRVLDVST